MELTFHRRKSQQLARRFEAICRDILSQTYDITDKYSGDGWRFDFFLTRATPSGASEQRLVDVKWVPTPEASLQVARNLASLHKMSLNGPGKHTLILSADVPEVSRAWLQADFNVDIWDRTFILQMATPSQHQSLKAFFEESDDWYAQSRGRVQELSPLKPFDVLDTADHADGDAFDIALASDPNESSQTGTSLCNELKELPTGNDKKSAKAFEQVVEKAFGFIFRHDLLVSDRDSRRTVDGLNIYDIVFRVRNRLRKPFWIDLTRDLRARVLIVECKNYGKAIRAAQIYTTERYLSCGALRPIAFIVTRKRPHKSAIEATRGAMRENGKLMLIFDEDDICSMLHMKDRHLQTGDPEDDPVEFLDGRLHQFLASLPR